MSPAIIVFVLFTNLTSCVKDDSVLAPTTEVPTPPAKPDDNRNDENQTDSSFRISITINEKKMTARLYDNPTARDFASRLPLTIDISDFAETEKIFTPSPGLTTNGAPHGYHPKAGDIASYSPWRNIAIYYQDGSSFSNDMIPVGRIEGDISALKTAGSLRNVRFEFIKENMKEQKKTILGLGKVVTENFTGKAWLRMLSTQSETYDCTIYNVTFAPSTRNYWHTHSEGQILICTEGVGYYQEKDSSALRLESGMVVHIPAGVSHWHGATPESRFTHIGITPKASRNIVEWGAEVTDEEYKNVVK